MALKLYHDNAYQREFESSVTAVRAGDGDVLLVALAETAFYPAAGGQPSDTGQLGGFEVGDVREEDGEVWHLLTPPGGRGDATTPAAPQVGARMRGVIDWERRFDHMQQHTGQHLLSQAFLQALGAQTVAVHMGQSCTLDLSVPSVTDDQVVQVERLANTIVIENRRVLIREVEPDEAAFLGLRRPPKQAGRLRIVEVEGFDRSACGGTHVRASGEVGPIVIRGWERYKGGVRIEFLCGWRTLRDYRWTRGLVRSLAGQLTTGERELDAAVARLRDRTRDLERELSEARSRLLDLEAAEMIGAATERSPLVVAAVFTGRPADELRALARAVTARTESLVIFAAEPDRRLLVARSPGMVLDAAAILREALAQFGGRGGGKPEAAEGVAASAPSAAALVDAVRAAVRRHRGSPDG
jgi:alanyl-tRNA synthetase